MFLVVCRSDVPMQVVCGCRTLLANSGRPLNGGQGYKWKEVELGSEKELLAMMYVVL
jgi:hypothetical protein